jgi:hypothetical protein
MVPFDLDLLVSRAPRLRVDLLSVHGASTVDVAPNFYPSAIGVWLSVGRIPKLQQDLRPPASFRISPIMAARSSRHRRSSSCLLATGAASGDQTRATNLQQFVSDILNSDYMNILSHYGCGSSGSLVSSVSIPSTDHDSAGIGANGRLVRSCGQYGHQLPIVSRRRSVPASLPRQIKAQRRSFTSNFAPNVKQFTHAYITVGLR